MDCKAVLSGILALAMIAAVVGIMWNRLKLGRGIGWQAIRFTTIVIALPLVGILALNDALTDVSATIIAGALGYAFANTGREDPSA